MIGPFQHRLSRRRLSVAQQIAGSLSLMTQASSQPISSSEDASELDTPSIIEIANHPMEPIQDAALSVAKPNRNKSLSFRSTAKPFALRILGQKVPEGKPWVSAAMLLLCSTAAYSQGILTVTPGATASTIAGTGTLGYSVDGGAASSATVAQPGAVAYDKSGNLYVADTNNHVVREITPSGTITTIAGTGAEGFSGDGGTATAAQLDTPTGVAVDASGNIYIADSHNHRIRKVFGGTITTVAGTGTPGFAGDGGAASAAQLALPTGVAVDTSGNVYIADTNNHRIREIQVSGFGSGNISTIAGDGEELYAGDGGAATAAALDSPTGVAVSSTGSIYVADRLNQRIRVFTVGGNIGTVAGSGGVSFSGGFSGDGASAAAAQLARPSGVSIDASGNVYVADSDNQRIRKLVNGGAIATVVGTGAQGFGVDGGASTSAILNAPKSVAPDASGNLVLADTLDQRIRKSSLPLLTFTNDGVGIASTPQSVTLANTGSAAIAVASISFTGSFTTASGGTCTATPISLAPGASCTQNVAFLPTAPGATSGSVVFGGAGTVPQTILLAGTGTQSGTTTTLTTNVPTALTGQAITFTATVKPSGLGAPSGNVAFYNGGILIGSSPVSGGSASISTAALLTGTDAISAVYSGDANFTTSSSATLPQLVEDFQLAVSGVSVLSVVPGTSATFSGVLQSLDGPFSFPIALSLTGLPPGATATFTPPSINLGSGPATATLTVQTAATASVHSPALFGGGTISLALLLLPFTFSRKLRRRAGRMKFLLSLAMLGALGGLATLTGCGSASGLLGQPAQTYTINLIGTATGANGAVLQHTTSVTLTVQ